MANIKVLREMNLCFVCFVIAWLKIAGRKRPALVDPSHKVGQGGHHRGRLYEFDLLNLFVLHTINFV